MNLAGDATWRKFHGNRRWRSRWSRRSHMRISPARKVAPVPGCRLISHLWKKSKMKYWICLNWYRMPRYNNTDAEDHVGFFLHSAEDQPHVRARSLILKCVKDKWLKKENRRSNNRSNHDCGAKWLLEKQPLFGRLIELLGRFCHSTKELFIAQRPQKNHFLTKRGKLSIIGSPLRNWKVGAFCFNNVRIEPRAPPLLRKPASNCRAQ